MSAESVATAFARAWTAAYTAGLPRETRDRRRAEIASDLWEQLHHEAEGSSDPAPRAGVAARVFLGMPADLAWRSGELRRARRSELKNLKVDREWDWRMRLISHTGIIVLIVFLSAMAVGGPQLLLVTLPLGAIAVAAEVRRLQRDRREVGIRTPFDISVKRRRRVIFLGACVALFAIGVLVNDLPSSDLHDRYWFLFVAPMMIALMVSPVALLMLVWSYLPRKDGESTRSPT